MARLAYGWGQHETVIDFGKGHNLFLATLQAATYRRFKEGLGYFLTVATGDINSTEVDSVSHWLSPASSIRFGYDIDDRNGDVARPVHLEWDKVAAIEQAMEGPLGVTYNYYEDRSPNVYFPFEPENRQ